MCGQPPTYSSWPPQSNMPAPDPSKNRRATAYSSQPPPQPMVRPVVNVAGVHFQPQVLGTQNGPIQHQYTPRSDFAQPAMMPSNYPIYPQQNVPCQVHGTAPAPSVPYAATPYRPGDIVGATGSANMMGLNQGCPAVQQPIYPMFYQAPGPSGHTTCVKVEADPAVGIGLTESETAAKNAEDGIRNGASDGGEFVPKSNDPYKKYWVQELNGTKVTMQRRVINRMNVRWVIRDGDFVAVRLDAGATTE